LFLWVCLGMLSCTEFKLRIGSFSTNAQTLLGHFGLFVNTDLTHFPLGRHLQFD